MSQIKSKLGVNVSAITFNEYGEMIVLDDEVLDFVSGGAKPSPTKSPVPTKEPKMNWICPNIGNC